MRDAQAVGQLVEIVVLLERRIEDGPYPAEEAFEYARSWALDHGLDDPGPPPSEEE